MRFIPVSATIPLPPTLPALHGICMTAALSSKNRDIIATHIQAWQLTEHWTDLIPERLYLNKQATNIHAWPWLSWYLDLVGIDPLQCVPTELVRKGVDVATCVVNACVPACHNLWRLSVTSFRPFSRSVAMVSMANSGAPQSSRLSQSRDGYQLWSGHLSSYHSDTTLCALASYSSGSCCAQGLK